MSMVAAGLLASGAFVAGLLLVTAVLHAAAARARRREPPRCHGDEEPLGAASQVALVLQEAAVGLALLLLGPLAWYERRPTPLGPDDRLPIVLVHGYLGTRANFFWLRRRLAREGWRHVYAVAVPPAFSSVAHGADRLADAIDALRRATGAPQVDVIAHSMGGLLVRELVCRNRRDSGVRRVVTLGTPHQGTRALAWLAVDPMLREVRPDSPTLTVLATDDPVPALVDFIALYSADDVLVIPPSNAYYPGAFNIEVRGVGHRGLLVRRRVHDLIVENLLPDSAARAATPAAAPRAGGAA
ncbi:MAG: alpha/beta fold hydrolase [Candidatus Binatia bacterium]